MLCKISDDILKHFSYFFKKIGFDISCKLSPILGKIRIVSVYYLLNLSPESGKGQMIVYERKGTLCQKPMKEKGYYARSL